jgi:hypothetical protein
MTRQWKLTMIWYEGIVELGVMVPNESADMIVDKPKNE